MLTSVRYFEESFELLALPKDTKLPRADLSESFIMSHNDLRRIAGSEET